MKRGDHLPTIVLERGKPGVTLGTMFGVEVWHLRCECGLTFRIGDTYEGNVIRQGKPAKEVRKIRTLADAKKAHRIHYLSPEAATTCDHPGGIVNGRVVCVVPGCREPL